MSEGHDQTHDELIDRPRGFLTQEDRRFLSWMFEGRVDEELSPEAARQRRYRIRKRARNAILDFIDLPLLKAADQNQIFAGVAETPAELSAESDRLNGGLINLFRFFADNLTNDIFRLLVRDCLEEKIRWSLLTKTNTHANVTVDIDVTVSDEISVDELKRRYEANEDLSAREYLSLKYMNRLSHDEMLAAQESREHDEKKCPSCTVALTESDE